MFGGSISIKDSFKNVPQKYFLEDMGLLIVKNNLPIQFVENIWLKLLVLCLCPKLNFPSKRQFSQEILPWLVEKTSQQYVLPTLADYFSTTISVDLWMSKGAYDVFTLVVNFLGSNW